MNQIIALTTLALTITAVPGAAVAQTAKDLVGTWTMLSDVNVHQDGSRVDVFGPHGTGIAIFDGNGHFAIITINPDVPKFAANNRAQGSTTENKAAVEGGLAAFGTYSVGEKVLDFTIEGSTYPNWTGTNQKRSVLSFTGDELKLALSPSTSGTAEITFKRVK
jgi:hypothetical protein